MQRVNMIINGNINEFEKKFLNEILNHARFNKSDVHYDEPNRRLVIQLRRHAVINKARKRFLWFTCWNNSVLPTIPCVLEIRNIVDIHIYDGDPNNMNRQEVINGGLDIRESDNEIYIGSFCERENPYGITVKVASISISIKDVQETELEQQLQNIKKDKYSTTDLTEYKG